MRLDRWLLQRGPDHVGTLLGNGASGKTALLYRMKLGYEVVTIPTIGLNVETIDYSGGGTVTMWDVGGCDQMRSLVRHYLSKDRFVLFVHDCNDHDNEMLDASVWYFHQAVETMVASGARHMWIVFNKQDLFAPEEAEEIVKKLKARFEAEISGSGYKSQLCIKILDLPGFSGLNGTQLDALLRDIKTTLKDEESVDKKAKSKGETTQAPSEEELVRRAKEAIESGGGSEAFWSQFLDGDLPTWDHYNHLRAGFFVMIDCFFTGMGIFQVADEFLNHLERLRAQNPERFRNTGHRFMTIFWLLQIQVAAISYQSDSQREGFCSRGDFAEVVLFAPQLMDTSLWRRYYSKDVLFSTEARENWRLPDLQALPTVAVTRPTNSAPDKQVSGPDPLRLPRFAYSVIQKTLSTNMRRGAVVKQALEALQSSTLRQRAADSSIPPYSETQAYFWIQITHALFNSLITGSQKSELGQPISPKTASSLTFEAFAALYDVSGTEWQEYYSQSTWESVAARMAFVRPDHKPLPNLFDVPTEAKVKLARSQMLDAASRKIVTALELPPREELDLAAAILIEEATLTPEEDVDFANHATLILYLHKRLGTTHQDASSADQQGPSSDQVATAALELAQSMGTTQSLFWVRQVQIAMAKPKKQHQQSFDALVTSNPHLAYEELPMVYYAPQIWQSVEARRTFIPADRCSLPSII